ncbi:cytochrome bd oxidase small subunit CydS [Neobacillus pocheonensis]
MIDFFIFYAPFIVVIAAIATGFWLAGKDAAVKR